MRMNNFIAMLSIRHLREKIRDNFPEYYLKIIKSVAPFITLLKYGVFTKSGSEAYWFLQYREGENKIVQKWGKDYSIKKPLILNLDKIIELKFPDFPGYNSFNPTVACDGDEVLISWRISDNVAKPFTDSHGRSIYPVTGFKGGIGIGTFSKNQIFEDGIIHNHKVLIEPDFKFRLVNHQIQDEYGRQVEFDDPRFIPGNLNLLLLHGRYHPHSVEEDQPNFLPLLFNRFENNIEKLEAPFMSKYEKNWVPLPLNSKKLKLLRSTHPLSIIEVNLRNLSTQEKIVRQSEKLGFHNGSNVILFTTGYYLRIVRQRIHLEGLRAIHFSTFMLHDLNMNLVVQTKPFLFQKYGFEICNSILQIDDEIFFVWGQNDETAFIGRVKTEEIYSWIFENAV